MMDLQTVSNWLLQEGYLVSHKGTHVLTQKYYEQVGQTPPVKAVSGMKDQYLTFIKEVFGEKRVRLPIGNGGGEYTVSDFSKPGMDAFTRTLKVPGMDYKRLVTATRAFYQDPRNNRPTIGNYFQKELWVSVYQNYQPAHITPPKDYTGSSNNELG